MNIIITLGFIILICYISSLYIRKEDYNKSFFGKDYTTIAKGIAILMIMVQHCTGLWQGGRILTPCGGIGVAIFLITSGYGLNESFKKNGLAGFWKKRFGRMYIPYMLVIIAFAIVKQWDWQDIVLNLTCYNSPYWFVTYIVECYIVFWLASSFIPKYRNCILGIISLGSLFLMPGIQAEQSFSFISGILISTHKDKIFAMLENKRTYWILCVSFLVCGIFFLSIKQLPILRTQANDIEMNLIQSMIKYPLGLHVLLIIKSIKALLKNPMLHLTGVISYELYLVHYPFLEIVDDTLWAALVLISLSFIGAYFFNGINNRMHRIIVSTQ